MSYLYDFRGRRRIGGICLAALLALSGSAVAATTHSSGGASASDAAHYAGDSNHLGDRWLRQGMTGHDVRVLQQFLGFAGFPTHITGTFDRSTTRSVAGFERKHNLGDDGIVTIQVATTLRKAVATIFANRPPGTVRINGDGTGTAPYGAPSQVGTMVAAANRIIHTSYCYAGGHGSWNSSCYDCSGTVSYVLHAAGLLSESMASGGFEGWGQPGPGRWVTIYTNPNHIWIVIAGRAFDTADFGGPNIPGGSGPRWRSNPTGNLGDGEHYTVRHPAGL